MNIEELTNTLDDLPKRLHDLYGFEILGGGDTGRPPRLQIGRAVRGIYAIILIDPGFQVSVSDSDVVFNNSECSVTINNKIYNVQITNIT
jgi:hypothetical protein